MLASLALVGLGVVLGLAVTLLGGGGGVFYLIVLLVVVDLPYQRAVPTSLATVILTTAAGSLGYLRDGQVAWRLGTVIIAGAIPGTYLGVRVVSTAPLALLERVFGGFLVLVSIAVLVQQRPPGEAVSRRAVALVLAVVVGAVTGLVSGTFGISGTPVLLPGLYLLGVAGRAIVGTSVFCLFGISLSGVGWYASLGGLDWRLVVLVGGGATVGALLATRLVTLGDADRTDAVVERVVPVVSGAAGLGFLAGVL